MRRCHAFGRARINFAALALLDLPIQQWPRAQSLNNLATKPSESPSLIPRARAPPTNSRWGSLLAAGERWSRGTDETLLRPPSYTWAVHSKEHGPCTSQCRFDGSPRLSLPFSACRSSLSGSTPTGEHHLDVPVSSDPVRGDKCCTHATLAAARTPLHSRS